MWALKNPDIKDNYIEDDKTNNEENIYDYNDYTLWYWYHAMFSLYFKKKSSLRCIHIS